MYLISVQLNCVVLTLQLIVHCCLCEKKIVVSLTNENSPFAESVKFLIDNLVPVFHFKIANHKFSLS